MDIVVSRVWTGNILPVLTSTIESELSITQ